MSLLIDLGKINEKKDVSVSSLKIGSFVFCEGADGNLLITKDETVIAEFKNNDWFLKGKSVNAMWETLVNHYESIKALMSADVKEE